jgi:hypothetical protein
MCLLKALFGATWCVVIGISASKREGFHDYPDALSLSKPLGQKENGTKFHTVITGLDHNDKNRLKPKPLSVQNKKEPS